MKEPLSARIMLAIADRRQQLARRLFLLERSFAEPAASDAESARLRDWLSRLSDRALAEYWMYWGSLCGPDEAPCPFCCVLQGRYRLLTRVGGSDGAVHYRCADCAQELSVPEE